MTGAEVRYLVLPERPDVAEDDPTPDPWDVRMMAVLAELSPA